MKRFKIYHPLWMSFASKDLYRDVAFNWKGFGFLYIALLVAISVAVKLALMQAGIVTYLNAHGDRIAEQVPHISIVNGVATVDAEQPVMIKVPDENGAESTIIVIDTTGEEDWLEKTDAMFLLTKTKLYAKKNQRETRVYSLSEFGEGDLDIGQDEVKTAIAFIKKYFGLVMFPVISAFMYVVTVFVMMLYGLFGLLFARSWKAEVIFPTTMRLATISATPAILIDAALTAFGIAVPFWGLAKYILMLVYLNLAVKWAFERKTETEVFKSRDV